MGPFSMVSELAIEEVSVRAIRQKMDEASKVALQRAINAGEENSPTVVSKKPGTKSPKIISALL
jgi:hypothetical protein